MSGARDDDELGQTATAPGSPRARTAPALGESLGRYRLERMLGEGGMGVVHAAFDPDLERRIALKVLRELDGGDDQARQRLLREARAMARLTHPNVVTVHEVGSANGRDFVAMELIDGDTLADWLRGHSRSRHEIVAAFVAAGQGLAAAHEASLVHRDFKPHNVLRRRDGRICVTDFGLARGVDVAANAFEATLPVGRASAHTPSPLSGLTATGSVLGTPAYMAPEQWHGGTIGPAADQFAFCVALWEALAGARPFGGATLDELKRQVERGPAELDASKLPRRLARALRRGLDPDPAKRWPSMTALLAAITRAERRPRIALTLAGLAVVGAAALYVVLGFGSTPVAGCPPPARDPALAFALGSGDTATALARDRDSWQAIRERSCKDTPDRRGSELACLDGVLARVETLRQGMQRAGSAAPPDAVLGWLVDPAVCTQPTLPRLAIQFGEDTIAAMGYALAADADNDNDKPAMALVTALVEKPGIDACARAIALRAKFKLEDDVPHRRVIAGEAINAAEACGDDRLRAEALLDDAPLEFEAPSAGAKARSAVQKANIAVARVPQADLVARVDSLVAQIAGQDHRWDDAFAAAERAQRGYAARARVRGELEAALDENELRFMRNELADMQDARASIAKWLPIAEAHHLDKQHIQLERGDAFARMFLGDMVGAHATIMRLYKPTQHPDAASAPLDGTVVDAAGHLVANATVAASTSLFADSIGPLPYFGGENMRITTTDAAGAFSFRDATPRGGLYAQLGDRRVYATVHPHARLVLEPTRQITGKVRLGKMSSTKVFVMLVAPGQSDGARAIAPLQADGAFSFAAVPTSKLEAIVATWGAEYSTHVAVTHIPAGTTAISALVLEAPGVSDRTFDVIARSSMATPLDAAQVLVMPGRVQVKTIHDLFEHTHSGATGMQVQYARPLVGEAVPPEAIGKTREGDLVAHFTNVDAGELTACVIGINGDLNDPAQWRKLQAHQNDLEIKCAIASASDRSVVIEAPPQKRLD